VTQVMPRMGDHRLKPTNQLVFTLRTGVKALIALGNRIVMP
jgi:hypothetical protein